MNSHVANLLKRFRACYGEPRSDEPGVLMAEYDRALKGYSAAVIEQAGSVLLDGLVGGKPRRFWPTISECRDACAREGALIANEARRGKSQPPGRADWQPDAIAKADRLIVSALGRKASDEGWILGLHDFCRKNGRLPEHTEIGNIIASSRGFDEAYAACCRGQGGTLNAALKKLGETMLDRRNKYAEMAHGVVP